MLRAIDSTSPSNVESRQQENLYFFVFVYLPLYFFVICNRSWKTKELTNQQIKDALAANNCTSVEFDEVKRITNTDQYPVEILNLLSKCFLEKQARNAVLL